MTSPRVDEESESARYSREQGLEELLTTAVNRVISERAPNAALRLAELLGAGAAPPTGRAADVNAELAEARAKLAEQDAQLAEAVERFEGLKEELSNAVARLPKEGSFRRKGGDSSFKSSSFGRASGSFSRSKVAAGKLTPRENTASSVLDAALSADGPLNAGSDSDSDF